MLIDQDIRKDITCHLTDPEFWDVKIVGTDGEIPANKTILSMRSHYFRSMFSNNYNFVESQVGSVKMPYPKTVLDKMVLYLYSGQLDCDEMSLRALMDLAELFNMMNLSYEYGKVETYTSEKIMQRKFSMLDCLKYLEDTSKLGLKAVGETLLSHLGSNFSKIYVLPEVGVLTEAMMIKLLMEQREEGSQTIFRFKTFIMWLSVNSMVDAHLSEVLEMFNFDDFTFKELNSDVRKSGFYPVDRIMDRMGELYESKDEFFVTSGYVRKCDAWFDDQPGYGEASVGEVRKFLMAMFDDKLPDSTLDKILELSDPLREGLLGRYQFKVASQLALRSSYHGEELPEEIPPQPDGDFNITTKDKRLYDTWFDKLGPDDGFLTKLKVMNDFKNRGFELSDSTLDYIYDMSEPPEGGTWGDLDRHGFSIFSHLTARAYFYGDDMPYPLPPQLSRENLSKL